MRLKITAIVDVADSDEIIGVKEQLADLFAEVYIDEIEEGENDT